VNTTKEKSAVGNGIPATEIEKSSDNIISDLDGKIKSKIIKSTYQHDGIVSFRAITDNSVVIEYRDGESVWYVFDNSDTVSFVYDIACEFMN